MKKISFADLIDKTILIGLSYYTYDNKLIEQKQYYGTVIKADKIKISVKLKNGEIFCLPPDLSSTRIASPGEYRLKSTGETVINPDYLTTWNINMPKEN